MVESMNSPVFIIGSPRSGTTLLRLMLTSHRNIVIPPECGFAVWWYEKYKNWGKSTKANDLRYRDFLRDLLKSKKIETWHIDEKDLLKFLREREPSSYSELVSCVYEWYGLSNGKSLKRWGDKNNFYIHHILTIKKIFPNACFVHIIRDGRDVACSYKELHERKIDSPYAPKLPHTIEKIAEEWKINIEEAIESFTRINWENVYEIKFEDLIFNTETSLSNLCARLGEEYDLSMLNYHNINRERDLEPKEFLKWKEKTLQAPMKSVVGRHKKGLTKRELKKFESVAGDILRRVGYL